MLNHRIFILSLLCLITVSSAIGQSKRYDAGQQALQSQNWSQAIDEFKQVKAEVPQMADAALYWQAFAEYKNGQNTQAERSIKQLIKNYPNSAWLDDAQVLQQENSHTGQVTGTEIDDELRLYAIQQLALNNPEKGLPLLLNLIDQSESREVKRNALHILGISGTQQAAEYLRNFVQQEKDTDLQMMGIEMLSIRGDHKTAKILQDIYLKTPHKQVKESVISGFIHNHDQRILLTLLEQETDTELADHMIHILGITGNLSELNTLFKKESNNTKRSSILRAMAIGGDTEAIKNVIATEKDKSIRLSAIESLIVANDGQLDEFILQQFEKTSEIDEKQAYINVLIATDIHPDVVYQMALNENNTQLQNQFINTLMVINGHQQLKQLYNQNLTTEARSSVIQALGVSGEYEALIDIYNSESDLRVKHDVINGLSVYSGTASASFLTQTYMSKDTAAETKKVILQALMVQNNEQALIELLKQETNTELKKQIIQMLSLIGSDAFLEQLINDQ